MQSQQGALASRGGTNVTGEINIFLGVQFDRAADFANDPHVQSHCNHNRGRARRIYQSADPRVDEIVGQKMDQRRVDQVALFQHICALYRVFTFFI